MQYAVDQAVNRAESALMYLAPEDDELAIADAAADFLADAMPIERLHGAAGPDLSPETRVTIGEMGWFALALSEERGGSGLTAVEHALFFREVGRQCGPVDMLAQALATHACKADDDLRAAIVAGEVGVGLLVADNGRYRLFGTGDATYALLASPAGASLHALDDAAIEERPSLDPANSLRLLSGLPEAVCELDGGSVWALGQMGVSAMLVGLAEAALDLIVEYAKVRETFGRAIGSYQAVRHTCADMAVRLEAARAQLWFAAAAHKEGRADAQHHIDAAKHLANETAMLCVDQNIQLHGGIGVTDEHDAHLLLKHAMLLTRLFGSKRALLGNLLHAEMAD
ncbi:MAG: acyl-CoA dehydrogenase [Sphingomonadaceae bacterium]